MTKILVVKSGWSKRKAFLVGAAVAAISVAPGHGLRHCALAWDFPILPCLLLSFGMLFVYPIVTLAICYPRLPNARAGLRYALGFGLGWFLTFKVGQEVVFRLWGVLRPVNPFTLGVDFITVTPVCVVASMTAWGLCRLFRGQVVVQDGPLCLNCGYSLIGNVSGRCPECGGAFEDRENLRSVDDQEQ